MSEPSLAPKRVTDSTVTLTQMMEVTDANIAGKVANMPVYDLIGGKCREAAMVYRHADGRDPQEVLDNVIRLREELSEQLRSLQELKEMASRYGYDISGPARNAREAVQWTSFGYLAAIKQQNGAAMSAGRLSTFWDIYVERDLRDGTLTESQAQEIIDDVVIKWRLVRFLRAPEYNQLFSGDPVWVTEVVGGMGEDGRTLVTKTAFRMLHTLYNLGPAPEPNLTVFWSPRLPDGF